jgi:hypothetical protein
MAKWQVQYVKVLVPDEQRQRLLRAAQIGLKDVLLAPEPRLDFPSRERHRSHRRPPTNSCNKK